MFARDIDARDEAGKIRARALLWQNVRPCCRTFGVTAVAPETRA